MLEELERIKAVRLQRKRNPKKSAKLNFAKRITQLSLLQHCARLVRQNADALSSNMDYHYIQITRTFENATVHTLNLHIFSYNARN